MSILLITIDNNYSKFEKFKEQSNGILKDEFEIVPNLPIATNKKHLFKEFSQAGFNIENYLLSNNYYKSNRRFDYVLLTWGEYSINNLDKINNFLIPNELTNNFLLFEHGNLDKDHSWAFGNIVAVVKWLSGLFKLDKQMFDLPGTRDGYMLEGVEFNIAIWFALRIGLKVYSVD